MRADTMTQDALDTLDRGDGAAALAQAKQAHDVDPLALDPLYAIATIQTAAGRNSEAGAALEEAVRLQPDNPDPWVRLAEFEFNTLQRPAAALKADPPGVVPRPPLF